MQGKATFGGHPIHPILIPFPIAFFAGALITDIIYYFARDDFWTRMSVVLLGFGIIGALVASFFGLIDYATARMSDVAKGTATKHMAVNLAAIAIFAVAFYVRHGNPEAMLGYVFTVLGNVVLLVGGYLGGHLAYHFGVGVDESALTQVGR